MIAYFPELYEDELLYSLFARYYAKSGIISYVHATEFLFENKSQHPSIEFINKLSKEALDVLCRQKSLEEIIMKHTMFPWYVRFFDKERRDKAFEALKKMENNAYNLVGVYKTKENRFLRYCPLCAKRDREIYGETYWRRAHQIAEVNICHIHRCKLISTDILLYTELNTKYKVAEMEIRYDDEIEISENELECELAEYITRVFHSDINYLNESTIGRFMSYKVEGTKYMSPSGTQINTTMLFHDANEYYKSSPTRLLEKSWKVQKVFCNYNQNPYDICMLSMYLNTPVSELVSMKVPSITQKERFKKKVEEMHNNGIGVNRIGKALGVSSWTIRLALENKEKAAHNYATRTGSTKENWNKIDNELFPKLSRTVKRLYYGNDEDRPKKITFSLIEKTLSLPERRTRLLPKCKNEIEKHFETQEHYWSREIIWSIEKLRRENINISITRLFKITNMRKADMKRCLPCLKEMVDTETYEMIENLLR